MVAVVRLDTGDGQMGWGRSKRCVRREIFELFGWGVSSDQVLYAMAAE